MISIIRRIAVVLALVGLSLSLMPLSQVAAQEGDPGQGDSESGIRLHVVQPGETLVSIANLYDVTLDDLRSANSFTGFDELEIGQRIVIPHSTGRASSGEAAIVSVNMLDSLLAISVRYGVPVEKIAVANRIVNPGLLVAGWELTIPGGERSATSQLLRIGRDATPALWKISLDHQVNLSALAQYNNIHNPLITFPGQVIAVPDEDGSGIVSDSPWLEAVLHPLPLQPGRVGGLRVVTEQTGNLQMSFLGQEWPVVSEEGTRHYVLLPVERFTRPGVYPLTLTFEDDSGQVSRLTRNVQVVSGGYDSELIKLPDEVAAVLNDPVVVQGELAYLDQVMSGFSEDRRWQGMLNLPAVGVLSSGFGTLRSYNGAGYDTFHSGADIAGAIGSPIYAPADGIVVDTGLLDVRGYVTIIDHGWGLYTGYWHQSGILVQPGEEVVTGQQIGTIGSTGLSTAPHLHWEMRLHGVVVDPMQWVREPFP